MSRTIRIDSRDQLQNSTEGFTTTVDLSAATHVEFDARFRSRYAIHLDWTGAAGGGSVTVNGTNKQGSTNYKPLVNEGTGQNMTLAIADGSGEDYIRDYVGIVDSYLVLSFSGFTAGTMVININFAM